MTRDLYTRPLSLANIINKIDFNLNRETSSNYHFWTPTYLPSIFSNKITDYSYRIDLTDVSINRLTGYAIIFHFTEYLLTSPLTNKTLLEPASLSRIDEYIKTVKDISNSNDQFVDSKFYNLVVKLDAKLSGNDLKGFLKELLNYSQDTKPYVHLLLYRLTTLANNPIKGFNSIQYVGPEYDIDDYVFIKPTVDIKGRILDFLALYAQRFLNGKDLSELTTLLNK